MSFFNGEKISEVLNCAALCVKNLKTHAGIYIFLAFSR